LFFEVRKAATDAVPTLFSFSSFFSKEALHLCQKELPVLTGGSSRRTREEDQLKSMRIVNPARGSM
jgi:hypothetical protein